MQPLAVVCLGLMIGVDTSAVTGSPSERPMASDKRRVMKLEDLYKFVRVADPQVSPDGKHVSYTVTTVDLEGNKSSAAIWLAPVGGKPKPLTTSGKRDTHPRWSPDGKSILFTSNRSGTSQLWLLPLDGGEARQLTTISTGAADGVWSRDGKQIAFSSSVYPEFSAKPYKEADALNKKKADEIAKEPVKAKVFTRLFYRHWDSYVEDKRTHLFVMTLDGDKIGTPKNVTPGDRDATPSSTTFATSEDMTFSPDGKYLLYTASPESDEAWNTNFEIFRVPVGGGKAEVLTADNPAADGAPRFSPDGKWLMYRAQSRPGFEADRWQLYVVSCDASGRPQGKAKSITAAFDGSPDSFVWSPDGKWVYFNAEHQAMAPIWKADVANGTVEPFLEGNENGSLSLSADGKLLAFTRVAMHFPSEIYITEVGDFRPTARNLSKANAQLLGSLDLPLPVSVTVKGAGGTPMQMWILKPPGFDEKKKWPVAYLVHGGPQGAWHDGWSFRWCPQMWAARGYVVAMPNPRGSTGFGQKYVEEISGDWGGKCYEDLMKGVDYLEKLSYVDKDRIGSAGASFGGYMMNWFAVNTGRFKCLITHCSVWNFESMWGTTDELWFDEYEHGGLPWEVPGKYAEFSPHKKAVNLKKFKTPMLVIHNDLDFRCPIGQGHELFTTLQRLKVPSKMINFPDEGHWVSKPKNGEYWHKQVFAWLEKYVEPGGK